jgi:hypothetical protein
MNYENEATIIDFKEDKGKNKDGRLTISIESLPLDGGREFLDWLGNEFINQGGLYAVDVVNPLGKYRIYKDKAEQNDWIELKEGLEENIMNKKGLDSDLTEKEKQEILEQIAKEQDEEYWKLHTRKCKKCGKGAHNLAPNGAGIVEQSNGFSCYFCGWDEDIEAVNEYKVHITLQFTEKDGVDGIVNEIQQKSINQIEYFSSDNNMEVNIGDFYSDTNIEEGYTENLPVIIQTYLPKEELEIKLNKLKNNIDYCYKIEIEE